MSEIVQAPALGYSITANIGDDKQLVVQCFADSEEELVSIHSKLDKAMAVVDRQKAKYKKVDTLKNLAQMEKGLENLKHDLNLSEKTFKHSQEGLDKELLALAKEKSNIFIEAQEKGRGAPVGGSAVRIGVIESEMKRLQEKRVEAEGEREMFIGQAATNITRYEDEIKKAHETVAECEALISGS